MKWFTKSQKLASYSVFSNVFLLKSASVAAQVTYFDIDPDIILDIPTESYYLDITGDAIDDIKFFNSSFDFYVATPFYSYWTKQDLIARLQHEDIFVAGLNLSISSFERYYPYALSNGTLINNDLNFYNGENQVLALRSYYHYGEDIFHCLGCYWYNYDKSEMIDHYLAIKCKIDLDFHYGWIRCDVLEEGRVLVIKDYAYEGEPNHPIIAGDTTHFVNIDPKNNSLDVYVYSFGKSIYIDLKNHREESEIFIYNNIGNVVYSGTLINEVSIIELKQPSGIYLIKINSNRKEFSKMVIISN